MNLSGLVLKQSPHRVNATGASQIVGLGKRCLRAILTASFAPIVPGRANVLWMSHSVKIHNDSRPQSLSELHPVRSGCVTGVRFEVMGAQIHQRLNLIVVGEGVGSDAVCDIDGCGVWGIILVDTRKIFDACGGDLRLGALRLFIMSWSIPGLRCFDSNGVYPGTFAGPSI